MLKRTLEIIDIDGRRLASRFDNMGMRVHVGSYVDNIRDVAQAALTEWNNVITVVKRTGVIANGQEWEAWVDGHLRVGPFFASTAASASNKAVDAIVAAVAAQQKAAQ